MPAAVPGSALPCNGWTAADGRRSRARRSTRTVTSRPSSRSLPASTGPGWPRPRLRSRRQPHTTSGTCMRRLALTLFALALAAPAPALATGYAVGLQKGASQELVARQIEARTGRPARGSGPRSRSTQRALRPSARSAASRGSSGCAPRAASPSRRTTRSRCVSGTSTAFTRSTPGPSCRRC